MWSDGQKEILSIIYGDDLVLIGDLVIARDYKKDTCKVIDHNGNMLIDKEVYGVTRVLGRGGFHYIVLTDKNLRYSKSSFIEKKNIYTVGRAKYINTKHNQINTSADKTADYVEYTYKIFNSKFECERVSKVRSKSLSGKHGILIEAGSKLYNLIIKDCILIEYNEYDELLDMMLSDKKSYSLFSVKH